MIRMVNTNKLFRDNGHYAQEGLVLKSTSGWGDSSSTDNYGFKGLLEVS